MLTSESTLPSKLRLRDAGAGRLAPPQLVGVLFSGVERRRRSISKGERERAPGEGGRLPEFDTPFDSLLGDRWGESPLDCLS